MMIIIPNSQTTHFLIRWQHVLLHQFSYFTTLPEVSARRREATCPLWSVSEKESFPPGPLIARRVTSALLTNQALQIRVILMVN